MFVPRSRVIALYVVVGTLGGCSGGGGKSTGQTFVCDGADRSAICLQNCSLGCNDNGCARTDIAQNEIVILQFSEAIDPNSVTPSSIRFRTPTGDQPIGEFLVNGNTVEFVPTLETSGGQTFFGFGAGETYTLTIPGGANQTSVVKSTSGKPFAKTMTCVLVSSLGIVDLNGVPPSATLINPGPALVNSAPRDLDVVLEFNEMIDATPFIGGSQSPVTFSVRRNHPAPGGGVECDPSSPPQPLTGAQYLTFDAARSVSVLTFRPTTPLPGNICVEIDVTAGVQDLAGKPAQPQTFSFRTVVVPLVEDQITEEFDIGSIDQFDADSSAGTWGTGAATFSHIGGTGEHGAFDLATMCVDTTQSVEGRHVWRFRSPTPIPAANTYSVAVAVTDNRYSFTSMVVPSDVRIVFDPQNPNPPSLTVAGRFDVSGDIDVSGASIATYATVSGAASTPQPGQAGALGGPFGGNGGKGGDKNITGTSTGAQPQHRGVDGGNANVLAGHAYAASAQTSGGRGSTIFPQNGLNSSLFFPPPVPVTASAYILTACAGGGGGGFATAGFAGRVASNTPALPAQMGPDAPGGGAVTLFPLPANARSSRHFLVGGAGGGGAATQACMSLNFPSVLTWAPGCGGGGGGGAIALRAGGSLRLSASSRLFAKGGSAPSTLSGASAQGVAAPGGGGSGGSIVLQSGDRIEIDGALDVRGGSGGIFQRSAGSAGNGGVTVRIEAGNGSNGFVRLETPTPPSASLLAGMQPAATADNLGVLTEKDDVVQIRTRLYSTAQVFGPEYMRYEIYATVDGVPIVLSDDPAVSAQEATIGSPVRAKFQCGQIDLTTAAVVQLGPWRDRVGSTAAQPGIATEGFNGFRYALFADYGLGVTTVTVEKVVVVYRH